jgi:hypothetical protein
VVLHGAVAASIFALFARLTSERGLALLAALLFLGCEDHSMSVGWIATITDLLCVLFIELALLAHLGFRETGRSGWRWASLLAFVAAMVSEESAALAGLGIVLLELWLPVSSPVPSGAALPLAPAAWLRAARERWREWGPAAALMMAYLVFYRAAGFGVSCRMYLNPMAEPAAYLQNAALRLPVMVLATLTPVPPSLAMFFPATTPGLVMAGLLLLLAAAVALRPLLREPVVAWSIGPFFVALLPQLATLPSERLLYLPMAFGCFVLARVVVTLPWLGRRLLDAPLPPASWVTRALALGVVLPSAVVGLRLSALYPPMFRDSLSQPAVEVRTAVTPVRAAAPERVVFVNTSGAFVTVYAADVRTFELGRRLPVTVLSSANVPFELERIDARTLVLRTNEPGWVSHPFANLVRTHAELERGSRWTRAGVTATVEEVTADGRDALAVRFAFDTPLDAGRTLLLEWTGERFAPLDFRALRDGERRPLTTPKSLAAMMLGE